MANKFLTKDGFKHFVQRIVGYGDISNLSDGTITGALLEKDEQIKQLSQSLANLNKGVKPMRLDYNDIKDFTETASITAPSDGVINVVAHTTNSVIKLLINGNEVCYSSLHGETGTDFVALEIQDKTVSKGDVIVVDGKITTSMAGRMPKMTFVPYKS